MSTAAGRPASRGEHAAPAVPLPTSPAAYQPAARPCPAASAAPLPTSPAAPQPATSLRLAASAAPLPTRPAAHSPATCSGAPACITTKTRHLDRLGHSESSSRKATQPRSRKHSLGAGKQHRSVHCSAAAACVAPSLQVALRRPRRGCGSVVALLTTHNIALRRPLPGCGSARGLLTAHCTVHPRLLPCRGCGLASCCSCPADRKCAEYGGDQPWIWYCSSTLATNRGSDTVAVRYLLYSITPCLALQDVSARCKQKYGCKPVQEQG